jgi:DNA-binding Lrp family transcriptional regulator
MPERKINDSVMLAMLDKNKKQAEIAEFFSVSPQAISDRVKKLRGGVVKNVVMERAAEVIDKNLNTVEQLQKINNYANELLDLLIAWNRGDDKALQVLESQITTKKVRVGDQEEFVREFKFKDPRELALKAMSEIRGQLKLQLEIFQTLFDMKAVQEFQKEVLTAIGEASPEVKNAIIDKLNQRRIIRQSIQFD